MRGRQGVTSSTAASSLRTASEDYRGLPSYLPSTLTDLSINWLRVINRFVVKLSRSKLKTLPAEKEGRRRRKRERRKMLWLVEEGFWEEERMKKVREVMDK